MKRTWKRDNLGSRISSAISIEETGLDSLTYGDHSLLLSSRKPRGSWSKVPALHVLIQNMAERGGHDVDTEEKIDTVSSNLSIDADEHKNLTVKNLRASKNAVQEGKLLEFVHHINEKRRSRKLQGNLPGNEHLLHNSAEIPTGEMVSKSDSEAFHERFGKTKDNLTRRSKSLSVDSVGAMVHHLFKEPHGQVNLFSDLALSNSGTLTGLGISGAAISNPVDMGNLNEGEIDSTLQSLDTGEHSADLTAMEFNSCTLNAESLGVAALVDTGIPSDKRKVCEESDREMPTSTMYDPPFSGTTHKSIGARNRWRRLKNTMSFAKHLASSSRSASRYIEDENRVEELLQPQFIPKEDVGGVGEAIFEGTNAGSRCRARGRKGMEALLVRQEKSIINCLQDFYVACLKMHTGHFLAGVFIAPVLLGLFFTPLYMFDLGGLTFDKEAGESKLICPWLSTTEKCSQYLNIFLYALSLSTTFGGSPVVAHSPYCILIANVNTLMAQLLFVFLSGAVFARMSRPSHPIRCSKKAIIRNEDFVPTLALGVDQKEIFRVFAVRLVLTGPLPCELVDAKICLTFRIFVKLPSGATFCATQNLELVRPEVSYLRYGIMVRHIINRKSPLFGHTMESLVEGDASFSLTIMGVERTSMQPIFHLQDYFACDGDVEWDADYVDFVETNESGQRVLNHSKIDLLGTFKVAGVVAQAISRMEAGASRHRREVANKAD